KNYLEYSKPVTKALEKNQPIIALESTIISHGLPYPQNIEVAKRLVSIAKDNGVIPATICLLNGKIKIGLNENELGLLAKSDNIEKVSRRDIGRVISQKKIGATTVAASITIANWVGIKVFATGGIGGVHRSVDSSFDISNDLIELSRTPLIVVSAGAKAILDLSKTLEFLETYGVPVYGYRTDLFPAFYSSKTKLEIDRIDSFRQIVDIYKTNSELGLNNGILIANPIPKEYEIPFDEMEKYINEAIQKAKQQRVIGRNLTPFLLAELVRITKGKSLEANIKLVENNVKLACEIAKEF
ncbi:MAG: pseudouridine-5'-phosphate glycosidase, partial [Candidatus Cloacimonetes bacterium]|nr:pseudouridine-5'-phosphate glycosidase [Candidatus Cloacimonadota bacterium]